jgi:hypothetical protein
MSIKARVCWGLTLVLYVVGLFLPFFAEGDKAGIIAVPPFGVCLFLVLYAFLIPDSASAIAFWGFGVVLPMALAHPALWWSWWAYARRKPVQAAVASGLAAVFWLIPTCVLVIIRIESNIWSDLPLAGYWCSFMGMAGMCLLALLSRGALRAEVQAARAEEQAARATAAGRDAVIAARLTEWAEGRADDPR